VNRTAKIKRKSKENGMSSQVVIVSVAAGGGHKTAMYSLGQSLARFAPSLVPTYFESHIEDLEKAHRVVYSKFTRAYDFFYDMTDNDWLRRLYFMTTSALVAKMKAEMRPLFDSDARLIISTHFMQTYALLQLKHELNSSVKIVAYIPDFDESMVHFPEVKGNIPDAVIAQSPRLLQKLAQKYKLPKTATVQAGYIPRAEFSDARKQSPKIARENLSRIDAPLAKHIQTELFTLVATGGTFWVESLYDALEPLARSSAFDWTRSQLIIACGNNKTAYQKYKSLGERHGVGIIPLPFLNYAQMALLFRSASAVVLSGVAPATLYELLETDAGPISIYRINPGPEKFNLAYVRQKQLAEFTPEAALLRARLAQLSRAPDEVVQQKQAFCKAALNERKEALARAEQMASFIEQLATSL